MWRKRMEHFSSVFTNVLLRWCWMVLVWGGRVETWDTLTNREMMRREARLCQGEPRGAFLQLVQPKHLMKSESAARTEYFRGVTLCLSLPLLFFLPSVALPSGHSCEDRTEVQLHLWPRSGSLCRKNTNQTFPAHTAGQNTTLASKLKIYAIRESHLLLKSWLILSMNFTLNWIKILLNGTEIVLH